MYGSCCVDYWVGKPVAKKPLFVKVDEYTDVVLVGLLDEFQAWWETKSRVRVSELTRPSTVDVVRLEGKIKPSC